MSQLPQLSLTYLHQPCEQPGIREPLFLLHGYGSNEEDLFSFSRDLAERYEVFSLRAPLTLDPFGYAWYHIDFEAPKGKWSNLEEARESIIRIEQFVQEALESFGPFRGKPSLLGFSQGAILSLALAFRTPKKYRRVVGLSGYLNTELLPETWDMESLSEVGIYCSHGTADAVIPVDWARASADFIEARGKTITYEEYPAGHGVNIENYQSFLRWMLAD